MPAFEVEFEVYCARCGAGLCNQTKTEDASHSYSRHHPAKVTVEPCKNCLEEAEQEGYEKGKEEENG